MGRTYLHYAITAMRQGQLREADIYARIAATCAQLAQLNPPPESDRDLWNPHQHRLDQPEPWATPQP